jgi:hypothetical protein
MAPENSKLMRSTLYPIPRTTSDHLCTRSPNATPPPLSFRPEWADASSHPRSREGVGPRSEKSLFDSTSAASGPPINDCSSVTKMPQIRSIRRRQLAHFQHVPNSCLIRAISSKRALLLSTTYSLFLYALCHFSHLQSFVFNLLWTLLRKTRGVGVWL